MFISDVRGRRAGRIGFGAVLMAGMVIMVVRLVREDDARAGLVIAGTWAVALVAYAGAGWWASRRSLAHADELAVPGLVVPSIGVALMYPLTLHLLVIVAMGGASAFDDWARISLVGTGLTHVVFAVLVAERAARLVAGSAASSPRSIYQICLAASFVPFGIFGTPPLIVAVTGLPALVLMRWMTPLADAERAAARPMPRAMVVAAPRG